MWARPEAVGIFAPCRQLKMMRDDLARGRAQGPGAGPTLRMAIVWAPRTFMALGHDLILTRAALAESLSH